MESKAAPRKRTRNRRRKITIRKKRKEQLFQAFAVSKELDDKKKELASTVQRFNQTKLTALSLTKQLNQIPKRPESRTNIISSFRHFMITKPTASSQLCSSKKCVSCFLREDTLQCKVNKLDRHSLNVCRAQSCDLGSGSFGKCTKMILCSTEVAVKETTFDAYSREHIVYEAMVMTEICCGHPNLPLFIGMYDHVEYPKPLLVMKFYSIAGKPCTFHDYLQKQRSNNSLSVQDWACTLIGVCNGLEAIHDKGYLHNDLKCNNIVLSDCIPHSSYAPSVQIWPIIIDFGKARSVVSPKSYRLSKMQQEEHLKAYAHLDPGLVRGLHSQSILSDIYSLGHVVKKVAFVLLTIVSRK